MLRLPVLAALALAATPAAAQMTDCSQAATQLDANQCAARGAEAADAELNATWAKAFAAQQDTPVGAKLREAQRAWIAYRDLACDAESSQYAGGSIVPLIHGQCLERLTRARTEDLKLFLPE